MSLPAVSVSDSPPDTASGRASLSPAQDIWWPLYFRCGFSKSCCMCGAPFPLPQANIHSHCESGEKRRHAQATKLVVNTYIICFCIGECIYISVYKNISMSCWNINLARFTSFALEIAKHLSEGAVGPLYNGLGKYPHNNIHAYICMYMYRVYICIQTD